MDTGQWARDTFHEIEETRDKEEICPPDRFNVSQAQVDEGCRVEVDIEMNRG